jgi:hypothetical protein
MSAKNVTVRPSKQMSSSRETVYTVERFGRVIGLVRKFRDTKTSRCPYQAFGLSPDPMTPNPLLGTFYAERVDWINPAPVPGDTAVYAGFGVNAKDLAVAAVVAAAD